MHSEDGINVINNEYDYSNIIPTQEYVSYLVEYCNSVCEHFIKLIESDEEKNKQYKEEYKSYDYKRWYKDNFEVWIWVNYGNSIHCKDIETFKSAVSDDKLKNINGLDIKLELSFKRGKGTNLIEYENSFEIKFKPYHISFIRKSNRNELLMTEIENNINSILKKFPTVNTIFCSK